MLKTLSGDFLIFFTHVYIFLTYVYLSHLCHARTNHRIMASAQPQCRAAGAFSRTHVARRGRSPDAAWQLWKSIKKWDVFLKKKSGLACINGIFKSGFGVLWIFMMFYVWVSCHCGFLDKSSVKSLFVSLLYSKKWSHAVRRRRTSLLTLRSSPEVSSGGDNRCVGDAEAGHPCWIRKSDGDELMNSQPTMEKEDETNNARHDLWFP